MKKIAIVSSVLPSTNYSTYLINALQTRYSKKVEILVYTSKERDNFQAPLKNIKLVWNKNFLYIFQILKQVFKEKPKIVHFQHEINMFGGLLTAVLFPFLLIFLKPTRTGIITTIHAIVNKKDINNDFLETFLGFKNKFLLFPIKLFFSFLYKTSGIFSDKIIVHTEGLKSMLVNDYHLQKNKIVVIPHGIPDKIEVSKTYKPSTKWARKIFQRKFILYFGYLHRRKGIECIFKAFKFVIAKFPQLILIIAGGTLQKDYEQELKKLVRKLDIEKNLVFTGFVDNENLNWLLDKCQFILLPAKYSISASGPLAQTIAHLKPTIVSDLGVFSEEIKNEFDGLLARNSPKIWAKQIERLLLNKSLYLKIVTNLRKKNQQRKWSNIAEVTYKLYQTILEK